VWLLSYALIFVLAIRLSKTLTFEVHLAVNVNNTIFWDVGPCSLVDRYQTTEHHSAEFHNFVGQKLLEV